MKIKLKKVNILNLFFLFLIISLIGFGYNLFLVKSLPVLSHYIYGNKIVIDPGHGTSDRGVVHKESGVAESPINLSVSMKLKNILSKQKYNIILTREKETAQKISNREELKRRVDMANDVNADIYISIHVNQFPDPKYFGAQCFYNASKPESYNLALLIQEELKKLEPENSREALPRDLFVLRETSMPAVLVELGFISNPQDRLKLQDPSYQEKLASAIAKGIIRYFNNDKPEHETKYN